MNNTFEEYGRKESLFLGHVRTHLNRVEVILQASVGVPIAT